MSRPRPRIPEHVRSRRREGGPRRGAPALPRTRAVAPPQRIFIENVTPAVDGGRFAVKRVVGDTVVVEADLVRDGHEAILAVVKWRRHGDPGFRETPMAPVANDRWRGEFVLEHNDRYVFTIEAWSDPFTTWASGTAKKIAAGQAVASEVLEGVALLERARAGAADDTDRRALDDFAGALRASARLPRVVLAIVTEPEFAQLVGRAAPRADRSTPERPFEVFADRPQARFAAWYELFPRSLSPEPGRHGTFRDAERRLPELRDLGFDILYLPPVHPIGVTNRKGRDNALRAAPGDPGSPWAIGGEAGGHTAIEPALGTIADFDHFVRVANELGLEVALDFAIQCSPDHPWVREHPEWFYARPDGTIKYAENPPKKYEDVYPVNFDTEDRAGLWSALRDVVRFWISHGVRVFRVDNPHTKPLAFWEWLIRDVQSTRPDVLFLAEAFTRPKLMYALAKLGFTQSYTYFTWRNTKPEITQYLEELARPEVADFFRPNFFANTPDILPEYLQAGGRPAFKIRLILAALLTPTYGIYSGFELCENEPTAPGKEEYLHSEKYELKARDFDGPDNLNELVARVNAIRRENPALQELTNLRFLPADSDDILFFVKATADGANVVLVAVNLDPHAAHECTVTVPAEAIGTTPGTRFEVRDLLTGAKFVWGERNYVRLDPERGPAHVLRVERREP